VDGPVAAAAVADLRSRLSGELVGPDHPSYEELRRVHNGTIDRRPALIARCKNTADVVDAVTFGQEAGLELSVRGGGHSVAGRAVTDGRLMIDLQPMKGIHVDPRARRARAQGGVTWGEYNRATHAFGVATTGGVISTTGIVGLTLGGGMGWLLGRFGLAIDNLLSAEIVTADGEIRTASAEDEPDLFWALRGGGGNFGVVTSFEYRTHPLRSVLGGLLAFPFAEAHRVFDAFRQATAELPDELTLFFGLVHAPDGSGEKLAALAACHSGEPAKADVDLKPLRSMPSLLLDGIETMPYPVVNTLLDDGYPKGARNYWKSAFMNDLSDDSVEVMIEAFASTPSSMNSILVEHYHGQATRVGVTDTAFPHREAGYNLGVFAEWLESADDAANTKWTKDSFSSLGRFVGDVSYVNYLDHDDGARVRAAYGPNWPRLLELKRRYDPKNVFHLNQNIDPRGD
jgi:FAD/FMN-containing dehydrogenase